ncbi:type II secretion system F family protein [Streptomyces zagrosensis]|uniref:Tight adherence protein B n=1 Tax=Streptomyces zagrosensis TaxID=1042984 RepID=A0A7W9QHT9_9ACTN|nr:type II secretion system F family protein [Streptomyces zagrosensis]MBB5939507.1 tight adherence protein B [Streptomyces zagrosensis]
MTAGVVTTESMVAFASMLCLVAALWGGLGHGHRQRRGRLVFADGDALWESKAPGPRPYRNTERVGGARLLLDALRRSGTWQRWRWRWVALLKRCDPGGELACLPAGCALALLTDSVLPLFAAVLAVPATWRWRRSRARARDEERRSAAVIGLCAVLAGELRAGRQPVGALLSVEVTEFPDEWGLAKSAARFGGDVPSALRLAARLPGAEGMAGVAACWRVAVDGGAGLAAGLERVAVALRAERDQREDLRAQLAGVRSTAVVLALLPAFGLVMGSALGADPLRVLLHTPAGLGCLALGVLLESAGLAWTAAIVRGAAEPMTLPTPLADKVGLNRTNG